ncbi:MAG: Rieske (2Fe-2S) protein [Planctomycetaceae bacterium]
MSDNDSDPQEPPHGFEPPPTRRKLLEVVTAGLSFLLMAVPASLGGLFFLDPLLRRRGATSDGNSGGATAGFIRLGITRDAIPQDGTPVAVTVITDLDDAWNRFRNVPVGSVWVRKNPDAEIIVLNSICPHLGCSVDYRRSNGDFFCPCHTSSFAPDGTRTNEIPPRNMDSLEVLIAKDGEPNPEGNEIWIRFQNFRRATKEKIPV